MGKKDKKKTKKPAAAVPPKPEESKGPKPHDFDAGDEVRETFGGTYPDDDKHFDLD